MTTLIIIFGALTLLAGIIIVINPEVILGSLRDNLGKPGVQNLAVVVRLVIGALLISQSSLSKFPLAIEIIGWLSIVAALFLVVIGRHNFNRIISWALSLSKPYWRIGGVIAAILGSFLIYAFA